MTAEHVRVLFFRWHRPSVDRSTKSADSIASQWSVRSYKLPLQVRNRKTQSEIFIVQKRIHSQKLALFSFMVNGDVRVITWVTETESVAGKVCLIKLSEEIFKNAVCYGTGKYQDVHKRWAACHWNRRVQSKRLELSIEKIEHVCGTRNISASVQSSSQEPTVW
jgi:hypothetical protein